MTFPAQLNFSDLDGTNGFVLNGIDADDRSGISVSGAGDINGDGINDLIIGAIGADPNGNTSAGESYVVFGRRRDFAASFDLSSLNGRNGFVINGIDADDRSGYSVSGAGDINGDGLDDLIIGARFAGPNSSLSAGESYVVFGRRRDFAASLNLSSLNGTNGFVINGSVAGELPGWSVSGAGDINGDGIDDLIIGAPLAASDGNRFVGKSYVVFGNNQGFATSLNLSDLDGSNGFVINGIAAFDLSGWSVSEAGDINGDGIDDLIIGASAFNSYASQLGESYVIFGSDQPFTASFDLSSLDGRNGFAIDNIGRRQRLFGWSVSGAGDVNGDGFDDLIIGLPGEGSSRESYVVFGGDQEFAPRLSVADLGGNRGFLIGGFQIGGTVDGAGDINDDGIDDLIVRETFRSVSVVFGSRQGFGDRFELSSIDGSNGFSIEEQSTGNLFTNSLSMTGDINGDGIDDLIIGAPEAGPNDDQSGKSYVVFGRTPTIVSLVSTDAMAAEVDRNPASFTITRTGDTASVLSIAYQVAAASTATDGTDFAPLTGTVTLAAGQTSATIVITPIDDTVGEGAEILVLELIDAANYGLDASAFQATITITDDDPTEGDDVLTGTEGRDVIFALSGNDRISSGDGNDRLAGQGGNDRLAGQAGNDQLSGGTGRDNLLGGSGTDSLTGGAGNDRLLGGASHDRITGNAGNDRLVGGAGADTLLGGAGNDRLFGGAGNDTLNGGGGNDQLRGSRGDDLVNGGAGNDRMLGGTENDTLNGQGGNDSIRAGAGNDVLRGGAGNDRLAGELGNDLIETGGGRDRISIRPGQGFDRVTDFEDGQDRIVLGGINFGQLSIQQRNNDVLISRGTERLLLLQNTNVGNISAADFA